MSFIATLTSPCLLLVPGSLDLTVQDPSLLLLSLVTLFVPPFISRVGRGALPGQRPVGSRGPLGLCLDKTSSGLETKLDKNALLALPHCPLYLHKSTSWDQAALSFSRKINNTSD
jgi:hypothetical protein